MARQSLRGWIQEALTDLSKDGYCSMMSCVHYVGSAEKEIHTVKMGADKQWSADELAELFEHKAKGFAQDLDGSQLFGLKAFYGGRLSPEAEHPFRTEGETFYSMGGTNSPDGKGLLQQMMRHTEAMTQLGFAAVSGTNALLMQLNQQLGKDLLSSRQAELDAVSIVKELVLKDVNNTHKMRMEQLEYQRNTEERKKWFTFGPALVNSLLGKEIFPQSSEDTALVETIIESLKPDDVRKLSTMLPPHLMGPLANRIQKHLDQKQSQRSNDVKALEGLDPEKDAAGETRE